MERGTHVFACHYVRIECVVMCCMFSNPHGYNQQTTANGSYAFHFQKWRNCLSKELFYSWKGVNCSLFVGALSLLGKPTWALLVNYLFQYTELYPISLTKFNFKRGIICSSFLSMVRTINAHFPTYSPIHWLGLPEEAYIMVKDGWLPMLSNSIGTLKDSFQSYNGFTIFHSCSSSMAFDDQGNTIARQLDSIGCHSHENWVN